MGLICCCCAKPKSDITMEENIENIRNLILNSPENSTQPIRSGSGVLKTHPIFIPTNIKHLAPEDELIGQISTFEKLNDEFELFSSRYDKSQPFVVTGTSKIGKTTLIKSFVKELYTQGKISGCIWLPLGGSLSTRNTNVLTDVATYFGIPTTTKIMEAIAPQLSFPHSQEDIFSNICELVEKENELRMHNNVTGPVIIVLDQLKHLSWENKFFQHLHDKYNNIFSIFITETYACSAGRMLNGTFMFDVSGARTLEVDVPIEKEESFTLFKKYAKVSTHDGNDDERNLIIRNLIETLKHHPGGLRQVVRILEQDSGPTMIQVEKILKSKLGNESDLNQVLSAVYEVTLEKVLDLVQGPGNYEGVQETLNLLAYCDENGMDEVIHSMTDTSICITWGLSNLDSHGFLTMSPIVRSMIRNYIKKRGIEEDVLSHILTKLTDRYSNNVQYRPAYLPHIFAILQDCLQYPQLVTKYSAHFIQCCRSLRHNCMFKELKNFSQKCVSVFSLTFGPEHKLTLIMESRLIFYDSCLTTEMEACDKFYLKCQKHLGPEDELTLKVADKKVGILRVQNKFKDGLKIAENVLQIKVRVYGSNHHETMRTRLHVAKLLLNITPKGKAGMKVWGETSQWMIGLGNEHVVTLMQTLQIAYSMVVERKFRDALPILITVLGRWISTYGDIHTGTLMTKQNLAIAMEGVGMVGAALQLHMHVTEEMERMFGENHPYAQSGRAMVRNTGASAMRALVLNAMI